MENYKCPNCIYAFVGLDPPKDGWECVCDKFYPHPPYKLENGQLDESSLRCIFYYLAEKWMCDICPSIRMSDHGGVFPVVENTFKYIPFDSNKKELAILMYTTTRKDSLGIAFVSFIIKGYLSADYRELCEIGVVELQNHGVGNQVILDSFQKYVIPNQPPEL